MAKDDTKAKPESAPNMATNDVAQLLAHQSVEDLEELSQNIQTATQASSKLVESLTKSSEEFIGRHKGIDPIGFSPYLAEVSTKLMATPEKYLEAQRKLWEGYANIWNEAMQDSLKRLDGTYAPSKFPDKRFAAPEWDANPMFDIMRRTYLLTSNFLTEMIEGVDGIDDITKRKASFATNMMASAFSPANFLLTNPVALRELITTKGQSLIKGMENLSKDLEVGRGRLSLTQTDTKAFKVGVNVGVTPGKVVYRGKIFELIQYTPTTEQTYEIPLLFFPPWINKFYIMDMRQDNSMIKWMVSKGYTVFVVSWINPTAEQKNYSIEDYMSEGVFEAVEAVTKAANVKKVNCVGYCIGGTLLATSLAYMAKIKDKRINAATFFASQQDFVEAGDLKIFTDDAAFQYIKDEIQAEGGVLDSAIMADTFNALRPNDLIWSFVINNYLMGKNPKPFDLLFWNSDQTRMPEALHICYLDKYYRQNLFSEGKLIIKDKTLNLKDIKIPVYMQSSKEDHIAPYRSIYRGARKFGGSVRMILAGSGHIAGVINHPDANKYQHWLPKNDAPLPETVEEWQENLVENPGSWWIDWDEWLSSYSGKMVAARIPGEGELAAICDAPGEYVMG
jgi:polyhydroxyalkanoate synthase subunit PhaC